MNLRYAFALTASVGAALVLFGQACLPSARFPACKSTEDCAGNDKAKICFDTRCVECQSDGDCGDGRYCETNSRECKTLGDVGTPRGSNEPVVEHPVELPPEPTASASAAPAASAAPSAAPKKK